MSLVFIKITGRLYQTRAWFELDKVVSDMSLVWTDKIMSDMSLV